MHKGLKILILVLASGWFMPVSCTMATAVLAQVGAADSERAWTPEQRPARFRVVARPGEGNAPFRVLTLTQLADFKTATPQASFLMDRADGRLDIEQEHSWVIYRVLAKAPDAQEIEVDFEDGDDQMFSRYRATATDVEPISTRYGAISRGLLMGAVFNGFILAFLLYVAARILKYLLRGRLTPPSPPPS